MQVEERGGKASFKTLHMTVPIFYQEESVVILFRKSTINTRIDYENCWSKSEHKILL